MDSITYSHFLKAISKTYLYLPIKMFKLPKRLFSEGPFNFMRKLEKPVTDIYSKLTMNYPFKSSTPITKTLINTSIGIYLVW